MRALWRTARPDNAPAMHLIGIPLRRPSSNEITASAVMAAGLWLAAVGAAWLLQWPLGRADAGALLLVVSWGCLSARVGIRIDQGQRHLLAQLLVSAVLLGLYGAVGQLLA